MAAIILFNNKTLTGSFQPSKSFLILAREITLLFDIVASAGPTTVQWYLEFSPSPTGTYYRELAEEDAGQGAVLQPAVVRTFADNGSAALANGTHNFDAEFVRRNQFCRVQMKVAAGAAKVTVTAPFGVG